MKKAQLSGSLRVNVGKKATKAVRNNGEVPCVLYGSGDQVFFSVRSVDVEKLIFTPDVYRIEIDIDGKKKEAIVQDFQTHPLTDKPLHVDFLELSDDKEIKINLPLRFVGQAKGVKAGGILVTAFRSLIVKGLPKDFPDEAVIDISPLGFGDTIHVGDIDIPGIKTLEDDKAVIISVKKARGAIETEDEDDDEDEEGSEEGGEAETKEADSE